MLVSHDPDLPLHLYPPKQPLQVEVLRNERLTPEDSAQDVRHVVIRWPKGAFFFVEGQSVGIAPPGLNSRGRPHPPRLYSVASARDGEDGDGQTLALTVKRYVYADESGQLCQGLSSSLLCDAQPGDLLPMTGPVGRDLLLGAAPQPLILIATGTGIAPFRAFLQQLQRTADPRPVWLFQGAQTHADLLYAAEWQRWQSDAAGRHWRTACSREEALPSGSRRYVQHALADQAEALWPWLVPGAAESQQAQIYLCGLRGMEQGVLEVLGQLAAERGFPADAFVSDLRTTGRLRVEVY